MLFSLPFDTSSGLSTRSNCFPAQDEGSYSKLVESIKSNFNDRYDDFKKWGGGIMGAKSQERTRQKEKAVAREAAKRLQA